MLPPPMSPELSSFETANYVDAPAPALPPAAAAFDSVLLVRAIAFGLAGAVLGAALYAGFILATHIEIGYLSIVIAFLVAKAMMMGSAGRGGRPFQVLSIVLTCVAVALGNAMMLYWSVSKEQHIRLIPHNILVLLRFGFAEPFLEFQQSAAGALLTFFILFIGLRAAWRMTSGDPNAVRHPFSR